MNITEFYRTFIKKNSSNNSDYKLLQYRDGMYIGYDANGNVCTVLDASSLGGHPFFQKTKMLSLECNVELECLTEEENIKKVHILKCFSQLDKERELFLEMVEAITPEETNSDEEIMENFQTLCRFFADTKEPSDAELIGLYAELDAIISSLGIIDLGRYWQSRDRMKFDFSFSDHLKLEVKATTKDFRIHHFRHEQLVNELYEIYILSYMLRHDDEGVSLWELLQEVKPLILDSYKKLERINSVIKNVTEERLKEIRFSPEYTNEKRHIYKASKLPRFEDATPDGVANAEYDCNLENILFENDNEFVQLIKETIEETENVKA